MRHSPSRSVSLLFLAGIALASRLPLLGNGFGSDDDAWRNAVAALRMHAVGHYVPSRIPGFPVYEGLLVPLVPFGWVATNALSAIAGLVAAWFLYQSAKKIGARSPIWLATAFCFSAPLWVHASQTMDYAVGLAFLLASYNALLGRRYVVGGTLLALAAGCRATLGVLTVPALFLAVLRKENARTLATLLVPVILTAGVLFLPVLLSPATRGMERELEAHVARHHATVAAVPGLLRQGVVFLFGKLGLVVLGLGLVGSAARGLAPTGRDPGPACEDDEAHIATRHGDGRDVRVKRSHGPETAFEVTSIILVTGLFLLLPYEPAYLMPVLPLGLLLVGRVLPRSWVVMLAVAMASEAFFTPYLDTHRIVAGRLFQEVRARKADLAETRAQEDLHPNEPTIYVIGRFATHRLLLLDPSLRPTKAAWAPFYASGVALWAVNADKGYASDLDGGDRARLEDGGYRIVDATP